MNMKSLKTQFIGAIAMVLVAAIAMGSSTYAWFSMNNNVTVEGMAVTTTVNNNLLIAETNAEAEFKTTLQQTRTGILEPTSTVNAKNFFYTIDANAAGSKIQSLSTDPFAAYSETATVDAGWANKSTLEANLTAAAKTKYDSAFNTAYGNPMSATSAGIYYGYIDYTFYLKAVSSKDNQVIVMDKCNLLYNSAVENTRNAWRAAMLVESVSAGATGTAGDETLVTVLDLTGSAYNTYTGGDADQGAASTTTRAAVGTLNTAAVVETDIDAGETEYYKVVVRLWLEGEDTSCNNTTYADLQDHNWALDLSFSILDSNTTAVTEIGSSTT